MPRKIFIRNIRVKTFSLFKRIVKYIFNLSPRSLKSCNCPSTLIIYVLLVIYHSDNLIRNNKNPQIAFYSFGYTYFRIFCLINLFVISFILKTSLCTILFFLFSSVKNYFLSNNNCWNVVSIHCLNFCWYSDFH